ncbi:hypothetical protein [Ensifer sp. BR816]|uniref:hypothetical protein n=1 Tax=Rhizobium sp. (strain BR816) TaxID=1057002 RepID=UPI0012FB3B2C|nr:hypothetical protein [Ensifer sp. BR816]
MLLNETVNHPFETILSGSSAMAAFESKWKDRISDLAWAVLSSPLSIGLYIAAAMLVAAFASATTGIPPYILVAAAVVLVLFIDPPERMEKLRKQRRR